MAVFVIMHEKNICEGLVEVFAMLSGSPQRRTFVLSQQYVTKYAQIL